MLGMMPELRKLSNTTTTNYTYNWFVLPDYSATSSSTQDVLTSVVSSPSFESDLFSSTNAPKEQFPNLTASSVIV